MAAMHAQIYVSGKASSGGLMLRCFILDHPLVAVNRMACLAADLMLLVSLLRATVDGCLCCVVQCNLCESCERVAFVSCWTLSLWLAGAAQHQAVFAICQSHAAPSQSDETIAIWQPCQLGVCRVLACSLEGIS
jgi:hypothetical protein